MTTDRDLEHILDRWLVDGASDAPDRVLDVVAERIQHERQRPAWRLDRRRPTLNHNLRIASVLAAALAVAVATWALLPRPSSSVGEEASRSPGPASSAPAGPLQTMAPDAGASCEATGGIATPDGSTSPGAAGGCLGPLSAGDHHSGVFQPKLWYTTPAGWTNSIDTATIFKLDPPQGDDPYLLLWSDARIAKQTSTCAPTADPSKGGAAADWIDFLRTHPGLVTSAPQEFPLSKGSTAFAVDVALAPTWTAPCPTHAGPYAMILTNGDGEYGVPANLMLHFVAVDVVSPGCADAYSCRRDTVVILSYGRPGGSGAQFEADTAVVRQMIRDFKFGCGPGFGRGPCGGGAG